MMKKSAKEVAELISGELLGQEDLLITGVNSIEEARPGDLTFADNPKHLQFVEKTGASCVITPKNVTESSKTIIRTENPGMAFLKILSLVFPEDSRHSTGIHPQALVHKDAVIGKDVSIGAHAVISAGAKIGDNSVIYPNCYIGVKTTIGSKTVIYPNVVIRERITIGNGVIIHSGTVVGADGFGYKQIAGKNMKIPQVGTVIVEDEVEIGSCVTIDRATLGKTVIGRGTKIDNLVQVAHNVKIGENCILTAQTGISGSSTLGKNVMLGGQAGLTDHVTLGDRVMVGAKAGVSKSFPAGSIVLGTPAKPYREMKRIFGAVAHLPKLMKKISEMEKKISALEKNNR